MNRASVNGYLHTKSSSIKSGTKGRLESITHKQASYSSQVSLITHMAEAASFSLFPGLAHLGPELTNPQSPSLIPEHKKDNESVPDEAGKLNPHPGRGQAQRGRQPAHYSPLNVQQRYALVRDTLVEVVDQTGKSAIVARHLIVDQVRCSVKYT